MRRASLRRAGLGLALASILFWGACRDPEPEIARFRGIPVGEVWPGPEQKLYSQGNEELLIRDSHHWHRRIPDPDADTDLGLILNILNLAIRMSEALQSG